MKTIAMLQLGPFAALELSPQLISLLGFAGLAVIFFGTGIYVVSGRWSATRPQRDAKVLADWEKVRRMGFPLFLLRRTIPFFFCYFFAGAFIHAWRQTHTLVLPLSEVIDHGLLVLGVSLIAGPVQWFYARSRAAEVHDRAARLQDESMS